MTSPGQGLTLAGTVMAVTLTAHSILNARLVRRPVRPMTEVSERVSILVPARDEAETLPALLASLRDQRGVPDLEILVLDDASTDDTTAVVLAAAQSDRRIRLLHGAPLAPGWLGKPHACHQLASAATGSVLVFVDADVVCAPDAMAATVTLLRTTGLDLVSPYPRPIAITATERLIQPLLAWSWLTTLPLRVAERSARPSLSAANGQLIAVDAGAYTRAGGHAGIRAEVLDDIALLRAVKRSGGRGAPADGSQIASCRMYRSWRELRDGYTKSLWSAFGSPGAAAAVMGVLGLTYVVPAIAALCGSWIGVLGYGAGVAGRVVSAQASGSRSWPDALAHPVSVSVAAWLTGVSWYRKQRGNLSWKGRSIG